MKIRSGLIGIVGLYNGSGVELSMTTLSPIGLKLEP